MPKKKSNIFPSLFKTLRDYWFIAPIVGGFVWTFANLPPRVDAVEKKTETIEQRTDKVEKYIQAIEEQKALIKKAPIGWKYDEASGEYIVYKDDPRLKKK